MKTHVKFQSDKFPPYEPEDSDINPGLFGKRLAEFLAAALSSHGLVPEPIVAEDWGWMIPIRNDEFDLWVGCGNLPDETDGFLCFIEPHTDFIRKLFKKIDAKPRIEALQQAMDSILSESAGIRNKTWLTYEEFSNAGR